MSTAPEPVVPQGAMPARRERVGSYELLLELAAGGMATVWLARAVDGRQGPPLVAIKRPHAHLSSEGSFLKMIVDEARLASAIHHPHVVKVRELGFEGGVPFIVMDYVEGASLAELRRELAALDRVVDPRIGLRIVLDALLGLHAAHELRDDAGRPLNIVHRDVSPHNVLIGHDGRSLITDFGIAHAENRVQTTRTHEIKGKLAYMAPERVDKRRICTPQSDLFSMAVVLWECMAGRRLFRSDDAVEVLQEVLSMPIPSLRDTGARVGDALDDVVSRALSRDLETRYATALELAHALERAAGVDVASHEDVARLLELVFGARMSERQGTLRGAVGSDTFATLLQQSGLAPREGIPTVPPAPRLADLAPPAAPQSARYEVLAPRRLWHRVRLRRPTWAFVAASLAVGSLATLALRPGAGKQGPIVVSSPTSDAPTATATASSRRVVLPLPFPAVRVNLDGVDRDLLPPADLATFEVPAGTGLRHRVVAIALDGTRAEGSVREDDGVARPDGDGFAYIEPMRPPPVADAPRATSRPQRAVGASHNGFTKLQ